MKKVIPGLLLLSFSTMTAASEYIKPGATLSLESVKNKVHLSINATNRDASGTCNMEGTAQSIDAGKNQTHRWLYNDTSSQCVAVISEQPSGKLTVKTKGCEGYCGMNSVGAMDGVYRKK